MSPKPVPAETSVPQGQSLKSIPKPILLSLLFYMGTLMITQTAFAWSHMTIRWVGLILLTATCGFCWLFDLYTGKYRWDPRGLPTALIFFLALTSISVFSSENFSFSALRWLSNVMLLLTCIVFLRGIFGQIQAHQVIGILKGITLILLLVSIFIPAPRHAYESPFFRGAMGDPNSMGHVAAISALIFLHGAFTSPSKRSRRIQGFITAFSIIILISTSARSSMVAFLVGISFLSLYYGITRSLLAKASVFLLFAFTLASPALQSHITGFLEKERPKNFPPPKVTRLEEPTSFITPRLTSLYISRESLWSDAWEGFTQRPFLGWGFSMNKDTPRTWIIGMTAIGMVRDATNDLLFILEGCGILGLLGYICLIIAIWRQSPTTDERKAIQRWIKKRIPLPPALRDHSLRFTDTFRRPMIPTWQSNNRGSTGEPTEDFRSHTHAIAYILSISLWVLFLFDGSAFSPGSLISAIFWISTGMAGAFWATATPPGSASAFPFFRKRQKSPSLVGIHQNP